MDTAARASFSRHGRNGDQGRHMSRASIHSRRCGGPL